MNTDQGRIYFTTGIDNSQLRSNAAESRNILHSIGQTAQEESAGIDLSFGKIAKAAGGIFAVGQITSFAKEIISVRGEIEKLQISFETLLGNKEKANAMFSELRTFAVNTPMMLKDLAAGAQTMLAFNIETEKVMPMLRAIGDVSMGDAQKFNSLTLAFSQMSATGKLMGQDLLQMINAGFNPLSVISEKTGKSIGDLKEEMEKGKISAQMVADAFISATSAGGKFNGMLEKQSHGIEGSISNLKGAIDDMYNGIGESSQGMVSKAIDGATYLVKHYEAVAEILAVIVGTYGIYKGAVIANEAMIQAAMTMKDSAVKEAFESEMEALTALIPQKEAEAKSSLDQAVAAGYITQEKAQQIAMLRAEAEAQMQSLATQEAAAKARMVAAQADVQTGLKWEKEIQDQIDALEEQADALFENGDSIAFDAKQEEIAALQSELLSVQKERESAAEAANTAANEMNAASHQQGAIATAEDSAATAINTAQTTTNTGVTSALSIAKTKLTGVVRTLYATISAHPFALAAAAVAALGYGIYKLITYETDAEKAQRRLNEAVTECEGNIAAERIQIDVMFDRLRQAKEGTDEYKDAKQAILDQYGNYLNGLSSEVSSLKDVEAAYKAVTEAALESARARAMDAYVKKEGDEYAKQYSERFDKMYNIIKKKKGQAFADAHRQTINDVISGKKNWTQEFLSQFDETVTVYMGQYAPAQTYNSNQLKNLTGQARKGEKDYAKILSDARTKFGVSEPKKEEEKKPEAQTVQNKRYWDEKKKEAQAELDALSDIDAKGAKGAAIRARIKGYDKKLGLYSVSSGKGGSGSGKSAADVQRENTDMLVNEAANRRKAEEEYARQVEDQIVDNEFEIRQTRIDAMKEGIEKELAQNELNYDKLIEQNKRRKRELLDNLADQQMREMEDENPNIFKRKNKDGKWEEDPGKREETYRELRAKLTIEDLDPEQKAQIEEFGKLAQLSFEKANKDSIDNMVADYLTYEQRKLKIAEEYARKREQLYETEVYKDENGVEKTRIKEDAQGNKVLRKGITQANVDELNRLEQEAQKALTKTFADRNVAELKLSIDWEKAFGNLDAVATSSLKRLKQKLQEYIKTQKDLDPENIKAITEAIEKIDEKLTTRNPFEALGRSFSDLATANAAVKKAQEAYNKALKEGTDLEKEQAAATLDAAKNAKQKALSEANQAIQATCKNLQEYIGVASALSDMLAAFGVDIPEEISGFLTGFSNALSGLESMDITRPVSIITGAIKGVTGVFQGIGSLFGFGNGDKKKEKQIENLQKQIDDLERSYDKLGKKVDDVYGKDAQNLINQQNAMLENQKVLIQNQISQEQSKKHSDNDRIKEWQQQIEDINEIIAENKKKAEDAIFGADIQSAIENFEDAMTAAWTSQENASKSAKDMVKSMMQQMVKESIKAAIQSSGAMEKIRAKLKEFYSDNVLSGWEQDYIYNMAEELQKQLDQQFGWAQSLFEEDQDRAASQKGIANASQDSIDELNGRMSSIQNHTYTINESVKSLLATTQAILRSVMNIESETDGFSSRLERIEGYTKTTASAIDDISTKGIRLKN